MKTLRKTGTCSICGNDTRVLEAKYCRPCYEKSKFGKPHPQKGHPISEDAKRKIGLAQSKFQKKHHQECDGSCGRPWCGNHKYTETKIHKKLYQFLINAGYCVVKEKRFSLYSADCFLPEYNLAFEADGTYWHSLPERIKSDKKRDKYIFKNFGVRVIRFSESEINGLVF